MPIPMFRLLLFIIVFSIGTTNAQVRLPAFEESNPGNYDQGYWFLRYLSKNYQEYITLTEFRNWNERNIIGSLAIRHDSAFIVTQTNYHLDKPQMQILSHYIPATVFRNFIDSLKRLNAFALRDEAEIEQCHLKKDTVINGTRALKTHSTANISNGLQTLIIYSSKKRFRFIGYYELEEASNFCPGSKTWKEAINVRDFLRSILVKRIR